MTNNEFEEVQRLIRLKRYESPGEEYYQSFAERFKERQRSELLRRSARSILLERLAMWFEEGGGLPRLVPAGAIAAAVIGFGIYFSLPSPSESAAPAALASTEANAPEQVETPVLPAGLPDASSLGSTEIVEISLPKIESERAPDEGPSLGFSVIPAGATGRLREL